jgi:aryl-alcohol dehydrogenase (NADP+)
MWTTIMEYVTLGRTGLKVSRLCLGTMTFGNPAWRDWVLPEDESRPFIHRALERGITFLDTADMYSRGVSEEILGRAIRDFATRDHVVIATKVYYPMSEAPNDAGLSRKHILQACDASLRRLGTDYIDLYQIHRWDTATPIEETLSALDHLVQCGKVRYLGASSMYAWQFAKTLCVADRRGWQRFVSMQNHYNLIYREEEREMIPLCLEEGIGVIPWSPLARGFLAGNRRRGEAGSTRRALGDIFAREMYYADTDFDIAERVATLAQKREAEPVQVALAWLLRQPGVVAPIIGATRLEQLDQLIDGLSLVLTDAECEYLEEPYQPHPVLGHE